MARKTLNLGILAHVDAGKTTLTERLLFDAGVIAELGSVDSGTTQTDTLPLERQRGITIRAAVVSFAVGDVTVNLIDTPGHPDFIAEVERSLSVLDGAVIVVSAVEGVQAQTRVLWRALERLQIPTIFFVNKTDRVGADCARVCDEIRRRLTANAAPALLEEIADRDDRLLADYVAGREIGDGRVRAALAKQTRAGTFSPVFCGSASTGDGIAELTRAIAELLPPEPGDPDAPLACTVFKIERGKSGEKIAYARLFAGTIRAREIVLGEKVTAVAVFERGGAVRQPAAVAGDIAQLWGLTRVRIGDSAGAPPRNAAPREFARPTLETVVEPLEHDDRHRLKLALTRLAEQDPLIDVRQDEQGTLSVSLYGEVQKEVIGATLAADDGLEVAFRDTTMICVERPAGSGEAVEILHAETNPFDATLGYRVEPAEEGSGIEFRLGIGAAVAPLHLYGKLELFGEDMERCVQETLAEGLYGWQVTDCVVTLTRCMYGVADGPPSKRASTTQHDYRRLTPLVLMDALAAAGSIVCEPIARVELGVPQRAIGAVLAAVSRLGGVGEALDVERAVARVRADRVRDLQRQLPGLTSGEGVLEAHPGGYRPVQGDPPARPRTKPSPLNRKEYLRSVGT
ncbi:MAG TPA: translation factor GTPase family protein [Gaiellaceae bacterium]